MAFKVVKQRGSCRRRTREQRARTLFAGVRGCAVAAAEALEARTLLAGVTIPAVPTPAGRWRFDEGAGTSAADTSGNGHAASLGASASWVAGNVGSNALRVNGTATALATAPGPVVDTSASFTVSAWVNLSALGGYQTFVAIAGTNVAGFYLQLRGDTGTFALTRIGSDSTTTSTYAASSTAPSSGTWYHLVGVDDVAAGTLTLYVDGQAVGTAAYAGGWKANGDTLIGHGFYNGGMVDYVNGSIDDVQMFPAALSAAQVAALDNPAAYSFDDGAGATAVDVSGHGNTLSLGSGATWTAGHVGSNALAFDATTNGIAAFASPVVDTSLPYSVSAWVKLDSLTGTQTFVSIDGANSSGFSLQFRADTGKFAFTRFASDSAAAQSYHADATAAAFAGAWYHLLGVNDVANGKIQLYVNGLLQSSVSAPTPWRATGATVIGGARSAGARAELVHGQVDEVRFFNAPLTASAAGWVPYIGSSTQTVINVSTQSSGVTVSPDIFGLFMEDINYGGEGGIYNDEVRNGGFNDSTNALNAWASVAGSGVSAALTSDATTGPTAALTKSGKLAIASGVSASARAGIANSGFFGVAVAPSTSYAVEFYAKASAGFTGSLNVSLESTAGVVYASAAVGSISGSWTKYTATLTTAANVPTSSASRLVISTNSPSANGATIWFGSAHLFPPSYNNSPAHLRVDLMEKLAAMKPGIFRVPGGNYLEGNTYADRFNWSKTIGRLEDRPGHLNSAWGYWSSDGMGLDEYLQMAELVGARPILAVFAGYTLNGTSSTGAQLTADVQDALNELHYVLDPVTTSWGALRAANGHPAPYDVREVEVGNEDWFSSTYSTRYPLFYDAIHADFPSLKIIATHTATGGRPYDILDEHFYNSAAWFQSQQNHYDATARGTYKIFVGEYAAREGAPTNNLGAALGDATFLLGLQENSDLVTMSSYAPLWANVNGVQWNTNLIGFDNTRSYGSPSFYAQSMLSNLRGSTVVSNSVSGAGGNLRTLVTKTGSTYYVTVINVGGTTNAAAINLGGVSTVWPTATVTTLAGASGTSTNSITDPTAVVPVTSTLSSADTSFTYSFPAYSLTILQLTATNQPAATVKGRQVFYNHSVFDGNNTAANAADDAAVATDKQAMLPGGVATFANYTSYASGINGVIVDIANLGNAAIDAGDFTFRVGNNDNLSTWIAAPPPTAVVVRPGAGANGSARVELTWADGAIKNQWLEVKARAGVDTGLLSDDVFYFGNAIGETGDSTTNAQVTANDTAAVNNHQAASATVTNAYDLNRDGVVNSTDVSLVQANQTTAATALNLISLGAPAVATPAAATPSNVTGTSTALSALGVDNRGESSLTYTWAAVGTPPAPVAFSANGTNSAKNATATFAAAGDYLLQVTITNPGGRSVTSSIAVVVQQTAAGVGVFPASASVEIGQRLPLYASVIDQFGKAMGGPLTGVTWSVSSGGGSIRNSGVYTAPAAAGTATVMVNVPGLGSTNRTVTVVDTATAWYAANASSGSTLTDSSGHNNTATLTGAYTFGPGVSGNAVSLTGGNANLPNGIVSSLNDFTIATWVNLTTVSNWSRIFDFGTGATVNMFLTPRNGSTGVVRFAITTSGGNGEQRINGTAALPSGAWTHVAVTWSGNTGILYVNGVEVGRNTAMTLTPSALGSTTQNYIGKSQYAADPALQGSIDDFRIFGRALGASEVQSLAALGSAYVLNDRLYVDSSGGATSLGNSVGGVSVTSGGATSTFDPATFSDILVSGTSAADALTVAATLPRPMAFLGGSGSDSLNIASGASYTFAADAGQSTNALAVTADGSAIFAASQTLASLTINGNASIAPGGGKTLTTGMLNVTGQFDLTDNRLVIHNGDAGSFTGTAYTGISGLVASGRHGGVWDGSGIITSLSAAAGGARATLGVTRSGTDVKVTYVLAGDANGDGRLDGDDYFLIDSHVGAAPGTANSWGWWNGDFDYTGKINGDDYFLLDSNIGRQQLGV